MKSSPPVVTPADSKRCTYASPGGRTDQVPRSLVLCGYPWTHRAGKYGSVAPSHVPGGSLVNVHCVGSAPLVTFASTIGSTITGYETSVRARWRATITRRSPATLVSSASGRPAASTAVGREIRSTGRPFDSA